MIEPEFTPERVADLQRQADRTMAALRERITAAAEVRERAMSVTGEATSQDGTVTVTVDSTGVVTSLRFAPSAFERSTPEKLASTVVATIQNAASKARSGMSEALAPLRAGGDAARSAMAGVPELNALRYDVPEVPRTAVDQSAPADPWAAAAPPPDKPRPDEPPEDWADAERLW